MRDNGGMPDTPPLTPPITPLLVFTMAAATGLSVASIYYAQPLLPTMARELGVSAARAGSVVTVAQLGYALGLLLIVPLGDLFERRALIVVMTLLAASGLFLTALAPNVKLVLAGAALTGLCSVVTQILVPFAATLARDEDRGKVVGTVMSGLLLGILLARTVAGALAALGSWRTVYWAGAVALLGTAAVLRRVLPRYHAPVRLTYGRLLLSIFTLFREEPVLRRRALVGASAFGTFSVLWTSMAFLLAAPPYRMAPGAIGLFGLAGVAGALAATSAGRLADRGKGDWATGILLLVLFGSWLPLAFAGRSLVAFVLGVLLLDLAVQGVHIGNQAAIYRLRPEARNRLTAGYMTSYFIGGALGSFLSTAAYGAFGWPGVVGVGAGFSALGGLAWAATLAKPSHSGKTQFP
jgi:predicted MFS family arabinose efflux permease